MWYPWFAVDKTDDPLAIFEMDAMPRETNLRIWSRANLSLGNLEGFAGLLKGSTFRHFIQLIY